MQAVKSENKTINGSEFLTTQEAQDFLRVSHTTLWDLRRKGLIPHYKFAKSILYKRSELESFVISNRVAVAAAA
jgi:excisionase family DNA binding protein